MEQPNIIANEETSSGRTTYTYDVTVILVTYNHEKYIHEAIKSVLNQNTKFKFEVVIIEDCSTDRTREIVVDYYTKHKDTIRLTLTKQNGEYHKEWAQAIESAPGKYIALLDGDDYWTSTQKLQHQVEFLDSHPDCSICFHNSRQFYDDGTAPDFNNNPPNQKKISTIDDLKKCDFIATGSTMFRSGLFSHFPDWFYTIYIGDWALHLLNAQYGLIGYIDEVWVATRLHSSGAWSKLTQIQKLEKLIDNFTIMMANLPALNDDKTRFQVYSWYYDLTLEYERKGQLSKARRLVVECLRKRVSLPYISCIELSKSLIRLHFPKIYTLVKQVTLQSR